MTGQREMHETIRGEWSFFSDALALLQDGRPLDVILSAIAEKVTQLTFYNCCSIQLYDPEAQTLWFRASVGHRPDYCAMRNALGGIQPFGGLRVEGPSARAFRTGQAVFIADADSDRYFPGRLHLEGFRSLGIIPLIFQGEAVGVLSGYHEEIGVPSESEVQLLDTICRLAAGAIVMARLVTQHRDTLAALERQHQLLVRSEAMHRRLTGLVLDEAELTEITQAVAGLMGNPVLAEDLRWSRLAVALSPDTDPDLLAKLPAHSRDYASCPEVQARLEEMASNRAPISIPAPPDQDWQPSRVVAPIFMAGEPAGYLSVLLTNRALEELDFRALEHATTVLALVMLKERSAFEVEQRLRRDFFDELLQPERWGRSELHSRATQLGHALDGEIAVLVLAGCEGEHGVSLLQQVESMLQRRRPGSMIAKKGEHLAIVTSAAQDIGVLAIDVLGVAKKVLARDLRIGIGRTYRDLTGVGASYTDALQIITLAQELGLQKPILAYADLGLIALLLKIPDKRELAGFANALLGPLEQYERRHALPLLATLECYLHRGCSVKETADALHIHINTLRHRLKKIREVAGIDLDATEHQWQAMMALRIRMLLRGGN